MAIIKLKKNSSISNCEEEVVKDMSNEQLENEWNDPSIVFEGEEYKNEYTNHYILNDGTSKLIISSEEKNYFDEVEKKWKKIDNSLVDKGDLVVSKSGKYKTKIHKPTKATKIEIGNTNLNLSWEYLGKKNNINQKDKKTNLKLIKETSEKNINKVTYENIEIDSDIEYVLSGNNIKENIIVKEKCESYEYSFSLKTNGLKVKLSDDNESIELYKEILNNEGQLEKKVEFIIPSPYMYDASGVSSEEVYYELESITEDEFSFTVIASKDWINSEERVLPVTIDPQIVVPSNKVITHQVQYRTISSTSSGLNYGQWQNETSSLIRVYKTSTLEYRTIINIKKSFINQLVADLSNVVLTLTPASSFSASFFVDGSGRSCNSSEGNFTIDLTDKFRNSPGDFTITLEPNSSYSDILFAMTTNPPYLTITYINDDTITNTCKTFTLAGIASSELDLFTGDLVTSICDVTNVDAPMGIPIYHIHKKSTSDYSLGNNFHLNLHEKLERFDDFNYVHLDAKGNHHLFKRYYYYINSNNKKTYIRSSITINFNNDGKLSYTDETGTYQVYVEYKSSTGLDVMTNLEGLNNIEYLEQRSNEYKQIDEQINDLIDTFGQFVVYSIGLHDILNEYNLNELVTNHEEFDKLYDFIDGNGFFLFLSESEAIQYRSLANNASELDDVLDMLATDSAEYAKYQADRNLVTEQMQAIYAKRNIYLELIKKYYKAYLGYLEEMDQIKRNSSLNYISDGKYYKGFNYNGNLISIFDMHENYIMIEYEKYLLPNGLYSERRRTVGKGYPCRRKRRTL